MNAHTTPFHTQTDDLDWLLEDFIKGVPLATCAVLASRDGLRLARHGLDVDEADKLSATLSGLHSLARSLGKYRRSDGAVRQLVIEHDDLLMFVMAAGHGSLLGVMTSPEADPGSVGYAMGQLVKSVAHHLSTPSRQERSGSDAGA